MFAQFLYQYVEIVMSIHKATEVELQIGSSQSSIASSLNKRVHFYIISNMFVKI